MRFLAFVMLLAACDQVPNERDSKHIQVVEVTTQTEVDRWCGKDVLEGFGCALGSGQTKDGSGDRCTIIVPKPKGNFDDREAMATWGHELRHCFKGRVHN